MKLWLVILKDKSQPGEHDIRMALIEGNELAAQAECAAMEREAIAAGGARCVGRYREIERGKRYKLTALVTPPLRTAPASTPAQLPSAAAARPRRLEPDDSEHRQQLRRRILEGHVEVLRKRHPDWTAARVIREAERLTGQMD
jgi:hypothetical protein